MKIIDIQLLKTATPEPGKLELTDSENFCLLSTVKHSKKAVACSSQAGQERGNQGETRKSAITTPLQHCTVRFSTVW